MGCLNYTTVAAIFYLKISNKFIAKYIYPHRYIKIKF